MNQEKAVNTNHSLGNLFPKTKTKDRSPDCAEKFN